MIWTRCSLFSVVVVCPVTWSSMCFLAQLINSSRCEERVSREAGSTWIGRMVHCNLICLHSKNHDQKAIFPSFLFTASFFLSIRYWKSTKTEAKHRNLFTIKFHTRQKSNKTFTSAGSNALHTHVSQSPGQSIRWLPIQIEMRYKESVTTLTFIESKYLEWNLYAKVDRFTYLLRLLFSLSIAECYRIQAERMENRSRGKLMR